MAKCTTPKFYYCPKYIIHCYSNKCYRIVTTYDGKPQGF